MRTLAAHGTGCGVLTAAVIPFLRDRPAQVRATVRAIAAAGATSATPLVLHLRPGAREWFTAWLGQRHPYLVSRYKRLYAEAAYAPKWYHRRITRQVHDPVREYGIGPTRAEVPHRLGPPIRPSPPDPRRPPRVRCPVRPSSYFFRSIRGHPTPRSGQEPAEHVHPAAHSGTMPRGP
ncbi:hypothetical protein APS67_001041 [Streptomyces sp. AVP053U2]|nr:hypothetical protein APS67_001041 [Streptomyces sp. AVP053U2]